MAKKIKSTKAKKKSRKPLSPTKPVHEDPDLNDDYICRELKARFKEFITKPIDPVVDSLLKSKQRYVANLRELAKILEVTDEQCKEWQNDSQLLSQKPIDLTWSIIELLHKKRITLSTVYSNRKIAHALLSTFIRMYGEQVDRESLKRIDFNASEDDQAVQYMAHWMPQLAGDVRKNERLAVAIANPKTAAIFVDRVWCLDPLVPEGIGFVGGTVSEFLVKGILPFLTEKKVSMRSEIQGLDPIQQLQSVYRDIQHLQKIECDFSPQLEALVCDPIQQRIGLPVTAFASSSAAHEGHLGHSTNQLFALTFESFPVVDESKLSWEQVTEIRKDAESRAKLRRLLHWAEGELKNNSIEYVRDEVVIRVEDYIAALNKHGAEVSLGCVEALLDWKAVLTILGTAAATYDISPTNPLLIAEGLAGTAFLGHALIKSRMVARRLRSEANLNPVAYLCELAGNTKAPLINNVSRFHD